MVVLRENGGFIVVIQVVGYHLVFLVGYVPIGGLVVLFRYRIHVTRDLIVVLRLRMRADRRDVDDSRVQVGDHRKLY